ncbi:MAG: trypsin-like serine protease [Myxococcota bacterium]
MTARALVFSPLLLALAACAAGPADPYVSSNAQLVFSGTEVVPGAYPWLVFTGGCTGALISPDYVLTAAHCYGYRERNAEGTLEGIAFSSGPVTMGHPDLDDPAATRHEVAEVLLHPDYIPLTRDEVWGREPYDMALLRLAEPVYLDDYLRLPTRQPAVGERVRVAGWGLSEDGRIRHAREAELEVRPRTGCFSGDEKRFCTRGGPDDRSANIGSGDSGGPVFVDLGDRFMSLGINSTSNGGADNTFASHAASYALVDWVLEATDGAFACLGDDPARGCFALVDECATGRVSCDARAACEDFELGFRCLCDAGYQGDGYTCEDVDECARDACSPDAFCTNTPGSFECECAPGFVGDGLRCEADPALMGDGGCSAGVASGLPMRAMWMLLGLVAVMRARRFRRGERNGRRSHR